MKQKIFLLDFHRLDCYIYKKLKRGVSMEAIRLHKLIEKDGQINAQGFALQKGAIR